MFSSMDPESCSTMKQYEYQIRCKEECCSELDKSDVLDPSLTSIKSGIQIVEEKVKSSIELHPKANHFVRKESLVFSEYKPSDRGCFNYFCDPKDKILQCTGVIKCLKFEESKFAQIPCHMGDVFGEFITFLDLAKCGIKKLDRRDFKGMHQMEALFLCENELESLPRDLLIEMKKLITVSFAYNKISHVEEGILDVLENPDLIDFRGNVRINAIFSSKRIPGTDKYKSVPLDELKQKIKDTTASTQKGNVAEEIGSFLEQLAFENISLEAAATSGAAGTDVLNMKIPEIVVEPFTNDDSWRSSESGEVENEESGDVLPLNDFTINFKNLKSLEALTDFEIHVSDGHFKLHRFILAAYSSALSDMFIENPAATVLKLSEFNSFTFSAIKNFIYEGIYPGNDSDMLSVFAVANKLDIEPIMKFAEAKLMLTVNDDNALDVLIVTAKCESNKLRDKAFEILQKKVPERVFKETWKSAPEKILKIINAKIIMDQAIADAKEDFESLDVSEDEWDFQSSDSSVEYSDDSSHLLDGYVSLEGALEVD